MVKPSLDSIDASLDPSAADALLCVWTEFDVQLRDAVREPSTGEIADAERSPENAKIGPRVRRRWTKLLISEAFASRSHRIPRHPRKADLQGHQSA